jgi:subtilisin family serine protease
VTVVHAAFVTAIALSAAPAAAREALPPLARHADSFFAGQVGLDENGLAAATQPDVAIVRYAGPITSRERRAIGAAGLRILEYVPPYAYLIRSESGAALPAAAGLPGAAAVLPMRRADKLAPSLLRAAQRGDGAGERLLAWRWDRTAVELPAAPRRFADWLDLADDPSIRWIEPASRPRLLSDHARPIVGAESVWLPAGMFGDGQVVAVLDSGLDTGDPGTLSVDFFGRVSAALPVSPATEWADEHGHGTHTAGLVLGAGVLSGADPATHDYTSSFAGLAPEASLVVQAFQVDGSGAIIDLAPDPYAYAAQALAAGAHIQSNSWGDYTGPTSDPEAMFGGYPLRSQRYDEFLWDNPGLLAVFAAGNSGADGTPGPLGFCQNGNGVIDPDSLLAPGTAKNVLTVGASESDRSSGGFGEYPWLLMSFCFAVEPIATDTIPDDVNGMAAFSSRGPTDDGRFKPDLVAPGTNIVSARSQAPGAGTLWGPHETNPDYVYSGGTSMSAPVVSGAAALVREWVQARGTASPSAALLKSLLIGTARDMAPGQYGTGPSQEIPYARPNAVAGWGRLDLRPLVAPPPAGIWYDDHTAGLGTSDEVSYADGATTPLLVVDGSRPLVVTLAWTDPPASLMAATTLVNDLDLEVVGPGGTSYFGNGVPSGDRLNNVEGVIVPNPAPGAYTVSVRAFNVPIATQAYALVARGALTSDLIFADGFES